MKAARQRRWELNFWTLVSSAWYKYSSADKAARLRRSREERTELLIWDRSEQRLKQIRRLAGGVVRCARMRAFRLCQIWRRCRISESILCSSEFITVKEQFFSSWKAQRRKEKNKRGWQFSHPISGEILNCHSVKWNKSRCYLMMTEFFLSRAHSRHFHSFFFVV